MKFVVNETFDCNIQYQRSATRHINEPHFLIMLIGNIIRAALCCKLVVHKGNFNITSSIQRVVGLFEYSWILYAAYYRLWQSVVLTETLHNRRCCLCQANIFQVFSFFSSSSCFPFKVEFHKVTRPFCLNNAFVE